MIETDLYEYPRGHVGTRRYVSVRGHVKSIPAYKTFRGGDGYNYLLPEFGGTEEPRMATGPFILPDKAPYQSPMDGSYITSRSQHREHMLRHNVVECGDRPVGEMKPPEQPKDIAQDIVHAMRQLESR